MVQVVYFALYSAQRLDTGFLCERTPCSSDLYQARFIAMIIPVLAILFLAFEARWDEKRRRK